MPYLSLTKEEAKKLINWRSTVFFIVTLKSGR